MNNLIEVCAAVIRINNRILICSRPPGSHMAGWWEFPGGKMEPGETPAACIEREIREELGIDVKAGAEIQAVDHVYPEKHVRVRFIECTASDNEPVLRMLDHQSFRWVRPDELLSAHLLPADRPFAEFLAKKTENGRT